MAYQLRPVNRPTRRRFVGALLIIGIILFIAWVMRGSAGTTPTALAPATCILSAYGTNATETISGNGAQAVCDNSVHALSQQGGYWREVATSPTSTPLVCSFTDPDNRSYMVQDSGSQATGQSLCSSLAAHSEYTPR
jgi:hypothetical protein